MLVAVVILLRKKVVSVTSSTSEDHAPFWTRLGLLLLVISHLSCAGRADLVPGPGPTPVDCLTDTDQRLLVTVSNQGKHRAIATTTVLHYENRPPIHVPTRPIAPQQSETLTVQLPDECLWSACSFQIQVDYKDEVTEKDEDNNRVQGECIRVGRRQAPPP